MFKVLKNSCCSVIVTCFVSTIANAEGLKCLENLSGVDCIETACEKFKSLTIKNKPDYTNQMAKWYEYIRDTCTDVSDLNKIRQIATENKDFYKISVPKSSVSDEKYFITVALDPEKIQSLLGSVLSKEYTSGFAFGISSNNKNPLEPTAVRSTCSDYSFWSGTPVDEAAININLKNKIPVFNTSNTEFFVAVPGMTLCGDSMCKLGIIYANYGDDLDTFSGYSEDPIKYADYDTATKVFDIIITELSGSPCSNYYLHLIDAKDFKTSISSKIIPTQNK